MTKQISDFQLDTRNGGFSYEYEDGTTATGNLKSVIDDKSFLVNPIALKPVVQDILGSATKEVVITGIGDSITQFGGDTSFPSQDSIAESGGYLGSLRRELNSKLGLSPFDGGCWIPPDATPSDSRVQNQGSPTSLGQYSPYCAYHDATQTAVLRLAIILDATGKGVTYSFVGRYLKVLIWENSVNSYNGNFSYSIDSAAPVTVTGNSVTDTYRFVTIDCGSVAKHTVVLSWISNKILICGALVTNGAGVTTVRFGVGGSTARVLPSRVEREIRTTFKTVPASLQIIRFSYNDWLKQDQVGELTTPELFLTSVQSQIQSALANPNTKAVLLLSDPATSSADTKARKYKEYDAVLKSLAVGSVAFYDLKSALPSYVDQNNAGCYVDFVHKSAVGYQIEGKLLAGLLTDTAILGI